MFLLPQRNKPISTLVFNLLQTKLLFCPCFEPFVLVGLQEIMGYHLLCLFSLVMLLCTLIQARNQLGTTGGAKSFLGRGQKFLNCVQ